MDHEPMTAAKIKALEKTIAGMRATHELVSDPGDERGIENLRAIEYLFAEVKYWRRRWATEIRVDHQGHHENRWSFADCLVHVCPEARAILEVKP